MISSARRYCSPKISSIESQVTAVALDISTHFDLPMYTNEALQSVIDVGLWGSVNSSWLFSEATDLRQRWNPEQLSSNPLERLAVFRYGYTEAQIHTLTQDSDPWIRAQSCPPIN